MIKDNDLDQTQEFTIESDADYYGKNEEILKRHHNLQYSKGNSPVSPAREGTFPKGAPRYPNPPVMPKDYRKIATQSNYYQTDKPHYPHTPDLPPKVKYHKRKYKSSSKLSSKKKNKLPRALSLLLAAGVLAGGIKAVTLGIDLSRDNALAESQQNLAEMTNRETALEEMGVYKQEDNSLEILNADLNNLLQKYKESPDSVTQEEVRNLLGACYQEGRNVVFSKMADAYNKYSQENDEYPKTIEAKDLIYRISDGKDNMPPYYIANRPDQVRNPNGTALPSNNELSDYISTQLKIKELYSNENLLDVSKSIELLKEGFTDINKIYSSDIHCEKQWTGNKTLVIDEYERDSQKYDLDNSQTSVTNLKADTSPDLNDEGR